MKSFLITLFVIPFCNIYLIAQTVPVGMPVLDESLRTLQLEGKLDIKYSLSSRPFFTNKSLTSDSLYQLIDPTGNLSSARKESLHQKAVFELLPVTFSSGYNSHHPYGWNHAGMIDAKGIQGFVSTGFFASIGPLSIQFKPEAIYAANQNFEYSSQYGAPTSGAYHHVFAGQSSVRLNVNAFSLGLSTENLWWGPGIQNSLLMSNNAPGFLHLTLNTTRPVKTPIGNFEFQLIAGKLTEDTTVLLENKDLTTPYYAQGDYNGYPNDPSLDKLSWRYLNGISISYNPKWVKGLFLGISRVAYIYNDYLGEFNGFVHDYLPVFVGLFRSSGTYANGSQHLKQIISVTGRYVFQRAHAEIYGEYGSDDNTQNLRDFLMSPYHGAAFTIGFKKLIPLANNKWIDLHTELTQLSQSAENIIRSAGNWYNYQGGYSNQGRILGAGYGMGSNMQTINASLVNGFKKAGIMLQRIVHDPNPNDPVARSLGWKDLSAGLIFQQQIKKIIINAQLQAISSNNYAWIQNNNPINIHGFVSMVYYW
ncbi:hypothetical protein GALL_109380 [mine drainage metagenome]|uniref:Capsule assembly protein Wzi n=1 Tax=mine drainage metagenome TaxID=410659 RepID=A0A1J5SF38_9ZZZZ